MAKKHKSHEKQVNHVIQSLKDLGVGGKDTLARLATTVRADAATVILRTPAEGKKAARQIALKPTLALRAKASLSRMALRIHPAGEPAAQRQVARELKRLNKRVKRAHQGPKVRKSRLPYVITMALLLIAGGGYWAMSKITPPTIHVAQYLDVKNWLAKTAGHDVHKVSEKATFVRETTQEMVPFEPVSPRVVSRQAVLPAAPKVLLYSSSKGAVGAKVARKTLRQARIVPTQKSAMKTASYRHMP